MGGNVNKYINVLIASQTSVVEEIVFKDGGAPDPASSHTILDKWLMS